MGIVNVTPDSFSDGGHFYDHGSAIEHGLRMVNQGADILDIGGESTRPNALVIDAEEEWRRVGPVIQAVAKRTSIPISIDTSKAFVAMRAIDAGAQIVNDVTGVSDNPQMVDVIRRSGAGVCVMHMQGNPRTMQIEPMYHDVVGEILSSLTLRMEMLVASGILRERICLDPGIGFGKTHDHNMALVRAAGNFVTLGVPILFGHSRKRFLLKHLEACITDEPSEADRDSATAGMACALAVANVQIVRVHAVALVRSALELFCAGIEIEATQ